MLLISTLSIDANSNPPRFNGISKKHSSTEYFKNILLAVEQYFGYIVKKESGTLSIFTDVE